MGFAWGSLRSAIVRRSRSAVAFGGRVRRSCRVVSGRARTRRRRFRVVVVSRSLGDELGGNAVQTLDERYVVEKLAANARKNTERRKVCRNEKERGEGREEKRKEKEKKKKKKKEKKKEPIPPVE